MITSVNSEIGKLEGVIVHTPGKEIENMTPQNAERALYSDILNLSVAQNEYSQFINVLKKVTKTFEVKNMLRQILSGSSARTYLLNNICFEENISPIKSKLKKLTAKELTRQLIEGVPLTIDNLTTFLSGERYALQPLHNLFFTRDSSISIANIVLIGKLANRVREREAKIMESIFRYHANMKTKIIDPHNSKMINNSKITIEGGDIIIAREDILLIGIGMRTTTQGVDFIIENLKRKKKIKHIIVQELPRNMESFIHLDMVFTLLDVDKCMIYKPVILDKHSLRTVHLKIDGGKVTSITEERNIPDALHKLGMDIKPVYCGGNRDEWIQEREQWHSGANFFAFAPGKILGYGRNVYTIEELNKNGFEVLEANDVIQSKANPDDYKRCVITIEGDELARGGGGCRCMTMPVRRKPINSKKI